MFLCRKMLQFLFSYILKENYQCWGGYFEIVFTEYLP